MVLLVRCRRLVGLGEFSSLRILGGVEGGSRCSLADWEGPLLHPVDTILMHQFKFPPQFHCLCAAPLSVQPESGHHV